MPNPYYSYTSGQPVAISRASSSAIRTEFGTIQSGFDAVNTAIIAKGAIAGQTWTGTHNFPATTFGVTAAFGSSGAALATLDYVNAVATNAALPGQAGKTDYLLTSNGTVASWGNTINVSVNKFVDGTDKTKQVQIDASGVSTGTTRTLSAPNQSGTLALTSDINASNGASRVLLLGGVATVSSAVANIDFLNLFTGTYDKYVIELEGLMPTGANGGVNLTLAKAGASDGGTVYNFFSGYSATATAGGSVIPLVASWSTSTSGGLSVTIEIRNVNDAVHAKGISARGAFLNNTPAWQVIDVEGVYVSANTVTGFRLACTATTFASGIVRVYGIKNS